MLTSIFHRHKWIKKYTNSKIDIHRTNPSLARELSDYEQLFMSGAHKTNQSLGRELGDYERFLVMSHDRGNQVLDGTVKIATKTILCNDMIVAALKLLQKQHRMLRMTIQKREKLNKMRYHFVEMQNPYVNFAVSETNDYDSVVVQQMMERFDVSSGPMWRVRLIKHPYPTVPTDLEHRHPCFHICNPSLHL